MASSSQKVNGLASGMKKKQPGTYGNDRRTWVLHEFHLPKSWKTGEMLDLFDFESGGKALRWGAHWDGWVETMEMSLVKSCKIIKDIADTTGIQ